jgi:hypothetical protein
MWNIYDGWSDRNMSKKKTNLNFHHEITRNISVFTENDEERPEDFNTEEKSFKCDASQKKIRRKHLRSKIKIIAESNSKRTKINTSRADKITPIPFQDQNTIFTLLKTNYD